MDGDRHADEGADERRRVGDVPGHGEAGLQRRDGPISSAPPPVRSEFAVAARRRWAIFCTSGRSVAMPVLRSFSVRPQSQPSVRAPASTSLNVDSHFSRNGRTSLCGKSFSGTAIHGSSTDTSRVPAGRPASCFLIGLAVVDRRHCRASCLCSSGNSAYCSARWRRRHVQGQRFGTDIVGRGRGGGQQGQGECKEDVLHRSRLHGAGTLSLEHQFIRRRVGVVAGWPGKGVDDRKVRSPTWR